MRAVNFINERGGCTQQAQLNYLSFLKYIAQHNPQHPVLSTRQQQTKTFHRFTLKTSKNFSKNRTILGCYNV